MTARLRFVNTASSAGGDGTTNATTGATRAYSSMNEAEAGEVDTLVDIQLEIQCTGTAADTSTTLFSTGWSVDASSTVKLTPNSSDINTTGVYDTNLYRIATTINFRVNLDFLAPFDHLILEGLQISITGQSSRAVRTKSSSVIIGNIFDSDGINTGMTGIDFFQAGMDFMIANNVIYNMTSVGLKGNSSSSGGTRTLYNNTVDSCGSGLLIGGSEATNRAFNNLLTNNTTDYSASGTVTSDNNVTSDGTSPDTGHDNKTITYTDAANGDYSTSDSDVVGIGTDLSADSEFPFDTDIKGDTRPGGAWDIGAFQEAASGASITANIDEDGDTTSAAMATIVSISANITEAGDTTSAAISALSDSSITANIAEEGDTTTAAMATVVSISANVNELGDATTATLATIVSITANVDELGDTTSAAISTSIAPAQITANINELGDTTAASIATIVSINANINELGDTTAAAISTGGVLLAANAEIDIFPAYSGRSAISPAYAGKVDIL
jgi:hypothetical protein